MAENTPQRSFGSTQARNALVGNQFSGNTHITIDGRPGSGRPRVCRSIPFEPNEDLVYRGDIARQLEQLLPPSSDYHSAALWGLGGSGKTQLALAYAYSRCRDPACSVFWIHADSETSFAQDCQLIARKLGLPDDLHGEDLWQAVRHAIEALRKWVLVLDNADNLALFGVSQPAGRPDPPLTPKLNLRNFVPRGLTGTVLWTSRDGQVESLVGRQRSIHVTQMTPTEAEQLLLAGYNDRGQEQGSEHLQTLLAELERFPLAISQAAAYMQRTSTPIKDYLSEIQNRKRLARLERSEYDRYRRHGVSNSILHTWDISMEYLKSGNRVAYNILHTLAYLDSQHISLDLIREAARFRVNVSTPANQFDPQTQGEIPDIDDSLKESITRLRQLSFLAVRAVTTRKRQPAYEVHKLVQEAARHRLQRIKDPDDTEMKFAKAAFNVTDFLFPTSQRETWEVCEEYLQHAQQAGEWARIHDGEEKAAELLARVSKYLYDRGRWREKELADKTSLRLRKSFLGDRHPDTIQSMAALATTYHNQGRYNEAETMKVEVLELRKKVLGDRHSDTIKSMASLAATYHAQGRYDEAETIYVEVLELRKEVLGDRHPHTISSMASLATTYQALGRYDKAKTISVKVLELRMEVLGNRHPDTIRSMADLATTYHQQGRYGEAERIQVEVLELRKEVLGDRHPDTIESMAALAMTYYAQGRHEKDGKISVEVLELRKEVLGDRHPDTISSMASLAATYHAQGRYDEAEKMKVEVLELQKKVLGDRHPDTIRSMAELATTYHNQGRYDKAKTISVEVLELRKKMLGNRHPDTIRSMADLATTYHQQGRYGEAERIKVEVLELRKEVLGDRHPDTIESMAFLAATYYAQGRYDKAETIYVEVLELRKEVLGDRHPDTVESIANLASTRDRQKSRWRRLTNSRKA